MGRLQKKKKPVDKRKKRPAGKSSASSPDGLASGNRAAVAASSSKDPRKRSIPSRKRAAARTASSPGSKLRRYPDIAVQFLREVMMELKKVTWPSRKQTTGSTVVMIILVAIFSIFLGTVDIGLSKFIQVILQ